MTRPNRLSVFTSRGWPLILVGCLSVFVFYETLWSHKQDVHPTISDQSFLARPIDSFYSPLHPTNKQDVRQGSIDEDSVEDDVARPLGHFFNPVTEKAPWWATFSGTAPENAKKAWDEAIVRYSNGQTTGASGAFHSLGRVLHFIQDMTSPAHVHGDAHLWPLGDDFENWGKANFPTAFPGATSLIASDTTAAGFVKEVALKTYHLTVYEVELDEVAGQQPDSVLSETFPSLHWDDGGLFGDAYWEIDRIGRFEDFPTNNDWLVVPESLTEDNNGRNGTRRLKGAVYIENSGGITADPVPQVFNGIPNATGKTLRQLYGDWLYPLAVGYGAGILDVFAQSVTGPSQPTLTITNLTDSARNPNLIIGDEWRLDLTGATPNKDVYLSITKDGQDQGVMPPFGPKTDGQGGWSHMGIFASTNDIGG